MASIPRPSSGQALQEKVRRAPQSPGVYLFSDARGKILYIGKAMNLRSRLKSYFRESAGLEAAKIAMLTKAKGLKWKVLASDIEALIYEAQLIKKQLPPYNVLLRDDKNYFYVGFTKEKFPRVLLTHQPHGDASYIGPFTEGGPIKQTMKLLRRIFPYATHHGIQKHCLFYDLELCPIPKTSGTWEQDKKFVREYQKNIKSIGAILEGKRTGLAKELAREMAAAARAEDFERAAKLRNQIFGLERIFQHRSVVAGFLKREPGVGLLDNIPAMLRRVLPKTNPEQWRIEGYDISNIQGTAATGSMVVFRGAAPDKNEYRKFRIKTVRGANDVAMMQEVLMRRFRNRWPRPDVMVIDGGRPQLNAAIKAVMAVKALHVPTIIGLAKREEEIYVQNKKQSFDKAQDKPIRLPNDHPLRLLFIHVRDESHRFAKKYHHALRSIK